LCLIGSQQQEQEQEQDLPSHELPADVPVMHSLVIKIENPGMPQWSNSGGTAPHNVC
jgi:hypothetical protein